MSVLIGLPNSSYSISFDIPDGDIPFNIRSVTLLSYSNLKLLPKGLNILINWLFSS